MTYPPVSGPEIAKLPEAGATRDPILPDGQLLGLATPRVLHGDQVVVELPNLHFYPDLRVGSK